jgi:hypothetical protein
MTTIQESKLNMYLALRNFILLNEMAAKLIPYFIAKYSPFESSIKEIQVIGEMQKDAITGIAKEKRKLREAVIKISADYSKMLAAIAKFANDDRLMDKVRFRISELRRMTDVSLKDYLQIIYDRVEENIGKLKEYEITPENLKIYKDLIDSYDASLSTPRTSIAEKSQTTKKLAVLFSSADDALSELDFAIEAGESKQPDFCNGYRSVRKVIDTGSGKLALKATAIEMVTGEPVKGVLFTFRPNGEKETFTKGNGEFTKKTADKGIFHIKSMQPGTYRVSVRKPGYKEKEVSVSIADGERSVLKVELEKV